MAENSPNSKNNLIDLAAKRQSMQEGRSTLLRGRKLSKTKKGAEKSAKSGSIRWYHYLQLVGFLMLVAWLMRSCSH